MVIGIDIRSLQSHHRFRGIGVYVDSLLQALATVDNANKYILFINKGAAPPNLNLPKSFTYELAEIDTPHRNLSSRLRTAWRPHVIENPTNHMVNIFFQPDIEAGLPKFQTKTVCVFYDLIPLKFKEHYFPKVKFGKMWIIELLVFQIYKKLLRNYRQSSRVISISNHSKLDLLRHDTRLRANSVNVVYMGVQVKPTTKRPRNWRLTKQLNGDPYFLYVGSCDYRKNIPEMIQAFTLFRDAGSFARLVLVGEDIAKSAPEDVKISIEKCRYKDDIVLSGFVTHNQRDWLYENSVAFLFTSLYEGFGFPPLEAMSHSCPVISYQNSALKEVLRGSEARIVSGPNDMANGMKQVLSLSKIQREKVINAGLEHIKLYSWHNSAEQLLTIFKELLDE